MSKGGAAGELAADWIHRGLGPLEQEAVDPISPT